MKKIAIKSPVPSCGLPHRLPHVDAPVVLTVIKQISSLRGREEMQVTPHDQLKALKYFYVK